MKKKRFEEMMSGARQMSDHASGKEVKGVREVIYDEANFCVDKEWFGTFVGELEKPAREIPALRKLLVEPSAFDEK